MTRERMDKALTFRNNNSIGKFGEEIDELDNKFAKVRFHEYVLNLQRVLRRPGKKMLRPRKRGPKFNNGPKKANQLKKKGTKLTKGKGSKKLGKRKNQKKRNQITKTAHLA